VVGAAVSQNASALEYASALLQQNRQLVLAAMQQSMGGRALKHAVIELKDDREVVVATVSTYGSSLQYASPRLRADRGVVDAAVTNSASALQYAMAAQGLSLWHKAISRVKIANKVSAGHLGGKQAPKVAQLEHKVQKLISYASYRHQDGGLERVEIRAHHSDSQGGGCMVFVPSLNREKSTVRLATYISSASYLHPSTFYPGL
jgi:hypothetical protein